MLLLLSRVTPVTLVTPPPSVTPGIVVVVVHLEGPPFCKWSFRGTGLLQMIIRLPRHLCQDPDSISRTFLEEFVCVGVLLQALIMRCCTKFDKHQVWSDYGGLWQMGKYWTVQLSITIFLANHFLSSASTTRVVTRIVEVKKAALVVFDKNFVLVFCFSFYHCQVI